MRFSAGAKTAVFPRFSPHFPLPCRLIISDKVYQNPYLSSSRRRISSCIFRFCLLIRRFARFLSFRLDVFLLGMVVASFFIFLFGWLFYIIFSPVPVLPSFADFYPHSTALPSILRIGTDNFADFYERCDMMGKSLAAFAFDKVKAGQIVRSYLDSAGISQRQAAPLLGMTDDMLSNVIRGQNKEISFERIFKICALTGHSMCDFLRDMLSGESVDFADQIAAICPQAMHAVHAADAPAESGAIPRNTDAALPHAIRPEIDAILRADRKEQAERSNIIHDAYTHMLLDQFHDQILQLKESRQITIDHYERRIAAIERDTDKRMAEQKEIYDSATEYLKQENRRLRKMCIRLAVGLFVESIAVIGLFIFDALNHNVGWFRSFLPYYGTSAPYSLRG